ncbi:unnamed protein product [Camellia sinensis]
MVSPIQANRPKRHLQKLLNSMGLLRGHHIIIGLVLLKHHPHGLHIVPSKTPIPGSHQIPQKQLALKADLDSPHSPGDLPGDKILSPPGRFMVEQNPITSKDAISFTVIDSVPMSSAFGSSVGRSRVERSGFGLRRGSRSEHFGGSGLVVLDVGSASGGDMGANGFEEAEGAGGDDVGGVIGDLKGDGDVGLGGEVVDLVGEDGVEPAAERGGVGEVGVVELHEGLVGVVGVDVDVVDSLGVEVRRPSDQAVDLVPFVQQEFGQVRPVLPRDARDQGYLAPAVAA